MSYIKQAYFNRIAAGDYGSTAMDAEHEHKWIVTMTAHPDLFNVECADCHKSEGGDMGKDEADAKARQLNSNSVPF